MSIEQLFSASLELSDDDRFNLALRMLDSVHDGGWQPPEWLQDQVADRVSSFRAGITRTVPVEDAIAAAYAALAKREPS